MSEEARTKLMGKYKDFLQKVIWQRREGMSLKLLNSAFKACYGYRMNHKEAGYETMEELLETMIPEVVSKIQHSTVIHLRKYVDPSTAESREAYHVRVQADCVTLLEEIFAKGSVFNMSYYTTELKKDFKLRFGYELNQMAAGYGGLKPFLRTILDYGAEKMDWNYLHFPCNWDYIDKRLYKHTWSTEYMYTGPDLSMGSTEKDELHRDKKSRISTTSDLRTLTSSARVSWPGRNFLKDCEDLLRVMVFERRRVITLEELMSKFKTKYGWKLDFSAAGYGDIDELLQAMLRLKLIKRVEHKTLICPANLQQFRLKKLRFDCQTLLFELLARGGHGDRYHLCCLVHDFKARFGYELDLRAAGAHASLKRFLETLPGFYQSETIDMPLHPGPSFLPSCSSDSESSSSDSH